MREVTDATFDDHVIRSALPVVVDFWAPWCGPCRVIEPILDQLADDLAGQVEFVKVNIDENPDAASRYGVLSLPTAIVFADGEPRETVVGARPRSHYERALEPWNGAATA